MNLRSCVGKSSACIGGFALGATIVTGASQRSGITSMIPVATLHRIATIDERYQSYNVEMAEVIGGNFWKPYGREPVAAQSRPAPASTPSGAPGTQTAGRDPSMFQQRPPIDLSNPRLRRLAAALGPAYMRTSGTWANMIYLHGADTPAPATAPQGFQGVLTRSEWKGVVDFAHAVNATLVSSFTVSPGVRASGRWTPDQARRLVAATTTAGGEIAAAEFFNEPDMPSFGGAPAGYTAADYARDLAIFRTFAKETAPQMKIVGPGSVGEGTLLPAMQETGLAAGLVSTESMLSASPKPVVDVFLVPLLRCSIPALRVDGCRRADQSRRGTLRRVVGPHGNEFRVLRPTSRSVPTGQAHLDNRNRRRCLRRQSVGSLVSR